MGQVLRADPGLTPRSPSHVLRAICWCLRADSSPILTFSNWPLTTRSSFSFTPAIGQGPAEPQCPGRSDTCHRLDFPSGAVLDSQVWAAPASVAEFARLSQA